MSDKSRPCTIGELSVTKALAGHVITLVAMLISIGFSYGALDTRVDNLEKDVTTLKTDLMPLMRDMQSDIGDVKVDLATLKTDMAWLKKAPEEKE